jgi:hypothetical protein
MYNPMHMKYIYNRIKKVGAPAKCSPLSNPITIRHNQCPDKDYTLCKDLLYPDIIGAAASFSFDQRLC